MNLRRYAHFTSPIRRYADLIVHRALVRALGMGNDGLTDAEMEELDQIAQAISDTERRAMAAERETADRLIAAHLADRIGAKFQARVSGLVRTGLFVRLIETGADGFVPASSIGHEYFFHDEVRQALVGEDTGLAYRLGDPVEVRLVEAIPTAGALRFEMLSEGRSIGPRPKGARGPSDKRGPRRLQGQAARAKSRRLSQTPLGASSKDRVMQDRTLRSTVTEASRKTRDPIFASMLRGALLKCPACGVGAMFRRYLKVAERLPALRRGTASSSGRRRACLFHHRHCRAHRGQPGARGRDGL